VQNLATGGLLVFVVIVQLFAARYRRQRARMRLTVQAA
jgi:hypothetical protein